MGGETRRQRRDARRALGTQEPRAAAPAVDPSLGTPAAVVPAASSGRGGFIRESWGELKKVEWPNRAQVVQGTIVVLIACAVVGAFLWGADQLLRPFVRDVLIG
ncbi:MAG: preprotein translocase subunit SecE [Gaiellales bacterium]